MSTEKEAFLETLKNASLYSELKKRLYNLALGEFEKLKTEYQSVFKLGIHEIPIGYVGVREPIDYVEFGMPNERFFWINCDGQKSEYFDGKWDVYHSAKLKLPFQNSLTEKELELIMEFDPNFSHE